MVCEACQEKEATVHIQEIVGTRKRVHHLCAECAEAQGLNSDNLQGLDLAAMLLKMAQKDFVGDPAAPETTPPCPGPVRRCRQCGLTEKEFSRLGRLGCPGCYTAFADLLDPLIREIQTGCRHTGKIPFNSTAAVPPVTPESAVPPPPPVTPPAGNDMLRLEIELKQAVQAEAYEKAAQLRDDIRQLRETQQKLKDPA